MKNCALILLHIFILYNVGLAGFIAHAMPQQLISTMVAAQPAAMVGQTPVAAMAVPVFGGEEGEMAIIYAPPVPVVTAPVAAGAPSAPFIQPPVYVRPQLVAQASQMSRLWHNGDVTNVGLHNCPPFTYNSTYPLTPIDTTVIQRNGRTIGAAHVLPFGIIADPDERTVDPMQPGTYTSYFLNGQLTIYTDPEPVRRPGAVPYKVELLVHNAPGQRRPVVTHLNYANRGAEYSELFTFNGTLYTADDKTGTVYTVHNANDMSRPLQLIPRYVVANGDGRPPSGVDGFFKIEWATTKDGFLYLGSHGYYDYMDLKNDPAVGVAEIAAPIPGSNGAMALTSMTMKLDQWLVDSSKRWAKRLSPCGWLEHLDWNVAYRILDKAMNVSYAQRGYLKHEAMQWSEHLQRWVVIPRYASPNQPYLEKEEGYLANHFILFANELFTRVEVVDMKPPFLDTHAIVSFKFIPGTGDRLILALKAVELEAPQDTQASYLNVLDILTGESLMEDVLIDDKIKYEGVEFL